jgi:hypothetical protein
MIPVGYLLYQGVGIFFAFISIVVKTPCQAKEVELLDRLKKEADPTDTPRETDGVLDELCRQIRKARRPSTTLRELPQ